MAGGDPFQGMKLSEQGASGGIEQRLFAPTPQMTKPGPNEAAQKPPSAARQDEPRTEIPKAAPDPKIRLTPPSLARTTFDLDDEALYKASFVFTISELEALEDLKLELKRELDTKVTKNDVIRAGLHMLVEDYRKNTRGSYVRRKVSRSNGSR